MRVISVGMRDIYASAQRSCSVTSVYDARVFMCVLNNSISVTFSGAVLTCNLNQLYRSVACRIPV